MRRTAQLSAPVAVGYCRVSTERQAAEDRTSLADQRAAIEQLAAQLQLPVAEWFVDAGVSGGSAEKRPAFMQLFAYCERHPRPAHARGMVLMLNASRFGRFSHPNEAAYWRWTLRRAGWQLRFVEGHVEGDGVGPEVVHVVQDAQSGDYRANIRANARRGAQRAAEQGFWHQEAPLGYRRQVVSPPGRERLLERGVRKAPDERVRLTFGPPSEVEAVRWAFEVYAAGTHTLRDLVEALRIRVPHRRWSRGAVQAMLRNPAYVGDVIGGRRRHDDEEGRLVRRPASEWYGKPDAHPPIVTRELFARVSARLKENAARRKGARNEYLLSGLVRCTICGHRYIGGGGMNLARDRNAAYKFYKDSGGHFADSACAGKFGSVGRHILDEAVVSTIAAVVESPLVQRAIHDAIDEVLAETKGTGQDARARLERRQRDLERRKENIILAIEEGTLRGQEARHRMDEVRAQLQEVEQSMAGVQAYGRIAESLTRQRERLLAMTRDFRALAARCDTGMRRALIVPWLHSAAFDKQSRRLTLTIRRIPEDPQVQSPFTARPAGRQQRAADTIERTLDLSQRVAKAAGWAR